MKQLLIVLAVLLPAEAHAISRYRSTSLSCAEVKGIVRAEGAALMRWTSQRVRNLPRYERVVAGDRFCTSEEYAQLITIPTADRAKCPVYHCRTRDFDDDFLFRRRR